MPRSYDHTLLCPGGGGLTYLISVDSSETKYLTTRVQVSFFQIRRKHMHFGMLYGWFCTLFSSFEWVLFWKVDARVWFWTFDGLWCQLPALQLCHVSSVLGLTYVIPLNRTNVDALVLWISLMPLAVLGVWGPLKALSTSPSIRIRTRVKYVQSGWLHLSAFFFPTQLIQGSPGQRQHLFFFFSNFQIFSPFFLSLIVLRNYMLINR